MALHKCNMLFGGQLFRSFEIIFKTRFMGTTANLLSESLLQRSFMYVPGDKLAKIEKIAATKGIAAPDIAVLDCEDGVGFAMKSEARKNIAMCLEKGLFQLSKSQVAVRINSIDSGLAAEDVKFILQTGGPLPHMINLPKVDSTDHFDWLADQLRSSTRTSGPPLLLTVMIESARAVTFLADLCQHVCRDETRFPFRLQGLVFGSDDYCATIGVGRSDSNDEIRYARQKVVTTAKTFGLSAIDMVDIDIKNIDRLTRNCFFGAQLGYTGKQVIHPVQLATVHATFSPRPEQIAWARGLLEEYQKQTADGQGVFIYRGQMIDMPSVRQAQYIDNMASQIQAKI